MHIRASTTETVLFVSFSEEGPDVFRGLSRRTWRSHGEFESRGIAVSDLCDYLVENTTEVTNFANFEVEKITRR